MTTYPNNQDRTEAYLRNFDREKTLKFLLGEQKPLIFDVGANLGATLGEFKGWWPDGVVHCFEPQQECWASLDQQAALHSRESVVINHCAVGNVERADAVFYSHDLSSGISGFNRINMQSLDSIQLRRLQEYGESALREYEASLNHERRVEVVRLDAYMKTASVDRINLLKIDTQGHEPEVLEGLGERLADVDVVITELMFYDYYERRLSFSDIEKFLLPAGLRLYDINHISKNPMNGRTDWVDVIYVNDRVRSRE